MPLDLIIDLRCLSLSYLSSYFTMLWMLSFSCQGCSLRALVPPSSWSRGPEPYSKAVRFAVDLLHFESVACRLLVVDTRRGCGSLPRLQQLDLLFHIVVPIFKPILLGSSATLFTLSFWKVSTFAAVRELRVELLVASIQDVHFWVEELGVLLHV